MRADEVLPEMAFPKAVVEAKVRAKEEMINLHLIKLLAFDVPDTTKVYWRKEILAETQLLAGYSMRVGRRVRRLTAAEYLRMLYEEPFKQNEEPYTQGLIRMAMTKAEQDIPLRRNERPTLNIASVVKDVQTRLSAALAIGADGSEIIQNIGATTNDDPLVIEAKSDGAPDDRHMYFYHGWLAHAGGVGYQQNVVSDWQVGWIARRDSVMREIGEVIANG